jgi:hypothetical protein
VPKIETVYLISHVHTDIGYTDHQNVLFRQQMAFIDRAIELCEATAGYAPEAQYRWTCEVSSMVERYVQSRPARQVDRFLKLHHEGRIAVAGMAYHWTPMLSPAAMVRSLYPVMRLRRDYGMTITSAMQCDVDGVSWLWADLLPAIGIRGLTMSINPYRGARPQPDLTGFWWQGPGGNRLLTYNGPHYAYGIFFYGMGSLAQAEAVLPGVIERLEAADDYPYDFLYAQATHPARPDNGEPYDVLSDLVAGWNASARSPRIEFVTVDGFVDMLHARYADRLPTWRGDWADWWADGVASSAYETSLGRTTEALLPALDLLASQADSVDLELVEEAYRDLSLYDEHTWGAFNSVNQPDHPFTRAQWNHKAGYAYNGYATAHEQITRAGRQLARRLAGKTPEGDVWQRWQQGDARSSGDDEANDRFLVVNPLGWQRSVVSHLPPDGGGGAPYNFLDATFLDNFRDGYPLSTAEAMPKPPTDPAAPVLAATLPAFGWQVVGRGRGAASAEQRGGDGWIENTWYRIEVDPATGGLKHWYDKKLGRELAGTHGPWRLGQYIYETVDDPQDREAIFITNFRIPRYGVPLADTRFRRQGPTQVQIGPSQIGPVGTSIELALQAPGAAGLRMRYTLPHHEKAVHLDIVIDKTPVAEAESIYIAFPLALDQPRFHLDLNGVPLVPDEEQLPGSCRDWYGIQRWAEAGDSSASIVIVPMDAPLVQVGGIQTGRWAERLQINEPTLLSWPVQNHWTTNFQAKQSGKLLFRYRLTSIPGYDSAAASRFAAEQLVPPIVVRAPQALPGPAGTFLAVTPEGAADVQVKRAADGRGLIVRAFNFADRPQRISIRFPTLRIAAACACSPVEDDGQALDVAGAAVDVDIPPRSLACARVIPEA